MQMKFEFLFAVSLLLPHVGSFLVSVEYLRRAHRFGSAHVDDYYFCCNCQGSVIQWGIDNTSLGGYTISDVGTTVVSKGNGYNFTTTLLSARQEDGTVIFDSILIISVPHNQTTTFEVLCTNNVDINTTSNAVDAKLGEKGNTTKNTDTDVGLEYILAAPIVQQLQTSSLLTHIFVCGTNSSSQIIGVPTLRAVGFSLTDSPGDTRNVKNNNATVNFQVILAARFIFYETTTFAFVTTSERFSLTCSYHSFAKSLNSSLEEYPSRSSPSYSTVPSIMLSSDNRSVTTSESDYSSVAINSKQSNLVTF